MVNAVAGTPKGLPSNRSRLQRFLSRRQFYPQLVRIIWRGIRARDRQNRLFVSLMGGVGDLVNFFPTLKRLSERYSVEMGTGGYPYRRLVENHPHIQAIYSPFVYKPIRLAHRKLIERALSPFYARVVLLDNFDSRWWARGKHIAQIYAEACGCPAPGKGLLYLTEQNRQDAAGHLSRKGLSDFIYVAQAIRHRRPFRSWPQSHYHELYRMIHAQYRIPILVDRTGSDEREVPALCLVLDPLDIMVAAALIERARLFIGPDSGLTHVAAALDVPTVSIHLGYPPESCRALGETVTVVTQSSPFDDPARTTPAEVFEKVEEVLVALR